MWKNRSENVFGTGAEMILVDDDHWPVLTETLKRYVNVEAAYHPAGEVGAAQAGNGDAAI